MRKVAFLLNSLAGGGTERVTLSLAKGLVQRGIHVTLLLVSKSGPLLASVDPRVVLVDFGKPRVTDALLQIRAYLRAEQPDVLFTAMPPVNIVGITARLIAGVKTAVIPIEHMPVSIDARLTPSLHAKVAYFLYPLFYRAVARIVTVSREAQEDFRQRYRSIAPEKVRHILNPVVTADVIAAIEATPDIDWFRDQRGMPILIGVGRLGWQKNFELLLHAFALVRKQMPCRLVILGSGDDRNKLEKLAAELGVTDDFLLPGFTLNPYACMAHSDLFVLSSVQETLSTVLIEALACGLPIVATNCTGVREIIGEPKYGTILSSFDPQEMAEAIIARLRQPTPHAAIKARAAEFNAERSFDAYIDLIEEVAGKRLATA